MNRASTILFTSITMGVGLIACSDNSTTGTGGAGGTGSSSSSSSSKSSSSSSSSSSSASSSSGMGGAAPAELKFIAQFDAANGELAEGLALSPDSKTAYVGFAPTGKIVTVSIPGGVVTAFGSVDTKFAPMMMPKGYLLGLALGKGGELYAGLASFDPTVQAGVYQVSADGKTTVLFASDPGITFPNGLTFDATGNLFVSDSASGAIFKIDANKAVTKWASDPLLQGDMAGPCKVGLGVPLGANGIQIVGSNMFVANTEKTSIVKIPIDAMGMAGAATLLSSSMMCMPLAGADGLAADANGTLYVAANGNNSIVHVATDGKAQTLISMALLDSPASISLGTLAGAKTAFITNAAFASAQTPGGMPKPGLLSYGPLQ